MIVDDNKGEFDDAGDAMFSDDDGASMEDPFEGLTMREQDLFFKVLDLVPDDQREETMNYFLAHPRKIRDVVLDVKKKKELLKQKDLTTLYQIFEQEKIALQQLPQHPATT